MTDQNVDLTLITGGTSPGWHMSWNGTDYGPGNYPPIPVAYNDTGVFTYTIKTAGVDFDKSPIGIDKGGKPAKGHVNGQIDVSKQSTSTKLVFTDKNKDKGDLNYVLYFNNKTTLDPIIQNGGCCQAAGGTGNMVTLEYTTLAIYLAIAFVLGIVAGAIVRRMRSA
jgi:hypothetical protein